VLKLNKREIGTVYEPEEEEEDEEEC